MLTFCLSDSLTNLSYILSKCFCVVRTLCSKISKLFFKIKNQFPRGFRQKRWIKRRAPALNVFYGAPRFVVLDEPNSSLDEQGDAALLHLLKTLKSRGTTLVIITHRANVLEVADRILVLVDGTVSAFGPRDEILEALRTARGAQATPVAPGVRPVAAIPPPRSA